MVETLPTEICSQICEYLDDAESLWSLLSFALCSKYCYSLASRVLFHTIYFEVSSADQLARDVQQLEVGDPTPTRYPGR